MRPRGADANTHSTSRKVQEVETVALRTFPIILKHGKKRLLVNCMFDESSDTMYVNQNVVEELGIHGGKEMTTVNVANDLQGRFPSIIFTFALGPIYTARFVTRVLAYATQRRTKLFRVNAPTTSLRQTRAT